MTIPRSNLTVGIPTFAVRPAEERVTQVAPQQDLNKSLIPLRDWKSRTVTEATKELKTKLDEAAQQPENKVALENKKRVIPDVKQSIYGKNKDSSVFEELQTENFIGIVTPFKGIWGVPCHNENISYYDLATKTPEMSLFEIGVKKHEMSLPMLARYTILQRVDAVISVSRNPDVVDLSQSAKAKVNIDDVEHEIKIQQDQTSRHAITPNLFSVRTQINQVDNEANHKRQVLVIRSDIRNNASFDAKVPGILNAARVITDSMSQGQKCHFVLACNQMEAAAIAALVDLYSKIDQYNALPNEHQSDHLQRGSFIAEIAFEVLCKTGCTSATKDAVDQLCTLMHMAIKLKAEEANIEHGSGFNPLLIGKDGSILILRELELIVTNNSGEIGNLNEREINGIISQFQAKIDDARLELNRFDLDQLQQLYDNLNVSIGRLESHLPRLNNADRKQKAEINKIIRNMNRVQLDINERSKNIKLALIKLDFCQTMPTIRLSSLSLVPVYNIFPSRNIHLASVLKQTHEILKPPMQNDQNQARIALDNLIALKQYALNSPNLIKYLETNLDDIAGLEPSAWEDPRNPIQTPEAIKMFQKLEARIVALNEIANPKPTVSGAVNTESNA